ncbi:MAG: hypothetical protein IJU95_00915 [Treponema sp.]|nr:hypothetical protein [Treponema sp.]
MNVKFLLAALAACVLACPLFSLEEGLSSLFKELDLYTGLSVKDAFVQDDKSREVKGDDGVAMHFRDMDLVLSYSLPYTSCNDKSCNDFTELIASALDGDRLLYRKGLFFRTDAFRLPYAASLSLGNLRFSGSLSRLKKPCLSAPWNYGSLSVLKPGLAASLPTFTSALSPTAISMSLYALDSSFPLPAFDAALLTEDGDAYFSLHKELYFNGKRSSMLYVSGSAGSFVYGGKEVKSWFYKDAFYRERHYLSADAELAFRLEKYMSVNLAAGLSENPHAGLEDAFFWRRGQLAFSFWRLGLTACHFEAEKPEMILPGGGRLNQRSRLSLNPSVTFPLGTQSRTGNLSLALLGMRDVKLKSGEEQDFYTHGLKASWKFRRVTLSGRCTDSFHKRDEEGEEGHTRKLSLALAYRGSRFSSSSSFTMGRSGNKDSISFSQGFHPASGPLSSLSFGFKPVYEDGAIDKIKVSMGAVFSFAGANTVFRGKIFYTSTFCGEF